MQIWPRARCPSGISVVRNVAAYCGMLWQKLTQHAARRRAARRCAAPYPVWKQPRSCKAFGSNRRCFGVFYRGAYIGCVLVLAGAVGLATGLLHLVMAINVACAPRSVTPAHAVRNPYLFTHYRVLILQRFFLAFISPDHWWIARDTTCTWYKIQRI